jgi:hypothetical protein
VLYIIINKKTILNYCGKFVTPTLFPLKFNYVELSKRDFCMNGFSLSVTEAICCGHLLQDTCVIALVFSAFLNGRNRFRYRLIKWLGEREKS